MRRRFGFVLFLFLLSALAGYLLSKASWVGRAGIGLFYQQYAFLKVWWQAGLLVFVVWLLVFFLLARAGRTFSRNAFRWTAIGVIVLALAGLYFTYQDFQHNTAHRWLGQRFHLGGYLFWLGWMAISAFSLTNRKLEKPLPPETIR